MAIVLHNAAVERAKYLIKAGEVESFDADWNEEKPTPDEVINFVETHFMKEYGLWFLGINKAVADTSTDHYVYPYGDLKTVQRSALVHTIKEAEKKGDKDIVHEAKKLLEMVDALNK